MLASTPREVEGKGEGEGNTHLHNGVHGANGKRKMDDEEHQALFDHSPDNRDASGPDASPSAAATAAAPQSTFRWTVAAVVFVATGISLAVGVQEAVYGGADDVGLIMIAYLAGMPFMRLLDRSPNLTHWRACVGLGTLDGIGNSLFAIASVMAGSSFFTVIYASITAVTALLRGCLLGLGITGVQWIGVVFVLAGLALTVHDADNLHSEDRSDQNLMAGVPLSFVCVCVVALQYIAMEKVQSLPNGPSSITVTWTLGTVELGWTLLYCVGFLLPNWDARVTQRMANAQTPMSWARVILLYAIVAVSCMAHLFSLLWIVHHARDGGVVIGILQAVRVLFVVLYGGMFLCSTQASQCFTPAKLGACALMVAGVVGFALADRISARLCGPAGWRARRVDPEGAATLVEMPDNKTE